VLVHSKGICGMFFKDGLNKGGWKNAGLENDGPRHSFRKMTGPDEKPSGHVGSSSPAVWFIFRSCIFSLSLTIEEATACSGMKIQPVKIQPLVCEVTKSNR